MRQIERLYGRTVELEKGVHYRSGIDLQKILQNNGIKYQVKPSDLQFPILRFDVNPDGSVQNKLRLSGVRISS